MVDEGIIELGTAAAVELAASQLAARTGETGRCANCNTSLVGPYCALCGQPTDVHRHGIWRLIHEALENFINFDSRIMRTFGALLLLPGELPLAFREGRTQRYVPALRLYLFVSLIFFVLLAISGIALMQFEVTVEKRVDVGPLIDQALNESAGHPEQIEAAIQRAHQRAAALAAEGKQSEAFTTRVHFFSPIGSVKPTLTPAQRDKLLNGPPPAKPVTDSATEDQIDKQVNHAIRVLAVNPAALNGPLTTWIPRVLFLLLPLYALLLALFYVRQRKKFFLVDHFVFSLNFHTFAFALLTIAVFLAQVLDADLVAYVALGALVLYGFIALKRFYKQGYFWTTVKFLSISAIYMVFFLAPALAGVIVAALNEV